jgi:hypothetical protein
VFLDCLDFQFELRQISLQFGDLLGLGLVTALKIIPASTAVTVTRTSAVTIFVPTITGFIRHFNSSNDVV